MKKLLIIVTLILTSSNTIFAQQGDLNTNPSTGGGASYTTLQNPIKFDSVSSLIGGIIDLVLYIAIPVLVFMFVWLGFRFVMAQGNPTKIAKVKMDLLYTIIGAAIVIGASAIQQLLEATISSLK